MSDPGTRYADAAVDKVIERLRGVYNGAAKDIIEKLNEHTQRVRAQDAVKRALVAGGKLSEADYQAWVRRTMTTEKAWKDKLNSAALVLLEANQQAARIVDGERRAVFGENATYQAYQMEHDAGMDLSFTVYDSATVTRIIREQPNLLPPRIVDGKRDVAWNREKISAVIGRGIIAGLSIPDIAKNIAAEVPVANEKAAVRYARTAMTAAQNAGRMEVMREATEMGIKVQKVWLATLDERTRDAHAEIDGDVREVNEPFENSIGPIMYPGDPSADDANVWNCRCTLAYEYKEYPQENAMRYDQLDGVDIEDITYADWKAAKSGGNTGDTPKRWTREEYEYAKEHREEILRQEKKEIEEWYEKEKDKLLDSFGGDFTFQRIAVKRDETLTDEEKEAKLEEIERKREEFKNARTKLQEERDAKLRAAYDKRDYTFDLSYEFAPIPDGFTTEENARAVNPNWHLNSFEYTHNCQRCALAFEVRERGYDVEACAAPPQGGLGAEAEMLYVFSGCQRFEISGKGHDNTIAVREQMMQWGEGSRAIVTIGREGGLSGHMFNAEYHGGVFHIIDSQVGAYWNDSNTKETINGGELEEIWTNNVQLYRTDNVPMKMLSEGWIKAK